MRLRPGQIIDCDEDAIKGWSSYNVKFYDKSFIESLKADTPFVYHRLVVNNRYPGRDRYIAYQGHIETPTAKVLNWAFPAFCLWCAAAFGLVTYVVMHWRH